MILSSHSVSCKAHALRCDNYYNTCCVCIIMKFMCTLIQKGIWHSGSDKDEYSHMSYIHMRSFCIIAFSAVLLHTANQLWYPQPSVYYFCCTLEVATPPLCIALNNHIDVVRQILASLRLKYILILRLKYDKPCILPLLCIQAHEIM